MGERFTTDGAGFEVSDDGTAYVVHAFGAWTVAQIAALDTPLRRLKTPQDRPVAIDLSEVTRLDTAGAWILDRTLTQLCQADSAISGPRAELRGATDDQTALMQRVRDRYAPCEIAPPTTNPYLAVLERSGRTMVAAGRETLEMLAFSGRIIAAWGRSLINPKVFRFTSFVHHMEEAGLNALPIIALMSFLIGGVLAYLGSDILETFGAQVLVVNLLSFAILREFGVLLTAIMIAGRSGSAFTAQIGSMKGREEIDAMRTLGLDPVELLVLPRVVALVVAAPLLTIMANFAGLFGGCLVAWTALGIDPGQYLVRIQDATELKFLWVGLIKAPIFAFLIAMIGCYQGMMVEGSAESVGRRTTKSVVEAIFVVIIVDAFFAMYFVEIDF